MFSHPHEVDTPQGEAKLQPSHLRRRNTVDDIIKLVAHFLRGLLVGCIASGTSVSRGCMCFKQNWFTIYQEKRRTS